MNLRIIAALVKKDFTLYFKNRFFALITGLGLVTYIAVYFLLPNSVDETFEVAWFAPELPQEVIAELETEGLQLHHYASQAALQEAVLSGAEEVGIALPADFTQKLARGEKPQAVIYYGSDLPDEFRGAYTLFLEELGYILAGQTLQVEAEEVILGPDMAGRQVPPRQRMLPLLTVFILMMETLGLASLITAEVETGTLRALLVTPLQIPGLFLSKTTTGVSMAMVQVLALMAITGGLQREPLIIFTFLLLGSLLVTGLSFLIASVARDMMSVISWGVLVLVALAIPSINILLPGLASNWIKILPSYYLVDSIHQVINFEAGWGQVGVNLLALLGFSAAFFGLGIIALRRKLQ